MKVSLVNPRWDFSGSIYFGCREPHLPLELGAAKCLLEREGHEVQLLDGALDGLDNAALATRVAAFAPGFTVVTTAPTYLFWRCAQPELRVPRAFVAALGAAGGAVVAIGPHGSATPGPVLRKLGADLVIRGEAEEAIADLARSWPRSDIPGVVSRHGGDGIRATDFAALPPLAWPAAWIAAHGHHHHRFGTASSGPGAEVEASRGCPYTCSFCAKTHFRDAYRRRDLTHLLAEIDGLIAQGARYLYFIDEIFLPNPALLDALAARPVEFGVQTRLDLWKPALIEKLGAAGCVSIEAGVESLTEAGRAALDKNCRMTTEDLTERLRVARRHVPFVQANLIAGPGDDLDRIARWRAELQDAGVWANDPVPMFHYPSSPGYIQRWGAPDDAAWERALDHYLAQFDRMSDIQDAAPRRLPDLETECLA